MRDPVTLPDRLQEAGMLLLMAGIVFFAGWELLHVIGKKSPARRRHGKYVLGWMVAGWLVGSAIGVCIIDNARYYLGEADTGMAGFGMLLGWPIGTIHGWVELMLNPIKSEETSIPPTPPTLT